MFAVITKDRPQELERCLDSIRRSDSSSASEIVVVDASVLHGEAVAKIVTSVAGNLVRSARGSTTHQRNVALDWISSVLPEQRTPSQVFVHFVDDDVTLGLDYADHMEACLNAYQAVGATGRPASAPSRIPAPWWRRVLLLSSSREGRLLSSGVNIGVSSGSSRTLRVDWLPGCSMSYRYDAIVQLRFDDEKEGYVLGEDVDFSAQAGLRGPLVLCNEARYSHDPSPAGRLADQDLVDQRIRHRLQLADRIPQVRRSAVIFGFAAEGLLLVARGTLRGSSDTVQAGWTTLRRLIALI